MHGTRGVLVEPIGAKEDTAVNFEEAVISEPSWGNLQATFLVLADTTESNCSLNERGVTMSQAFV